MAHPNIKLLERALGIEAVEHDLRGGDRNLRQLEQLSHLLNALTPEHPLPHEHVLVIVCHTWHCVRGAPADFDPLPPRYGREAAQKYF